MANPNQSEEILNQQIQRNLADKLYEKRKQGALEVEAMVKEWNVQNDKVILLKLINFLTEYYMNSPNANYRKGGLIALAAVAIGLGGEIYTIITEIVEPILKSFVDNDSRVRYYACESMYNVTKVSRGRILVFFNDIFDGMCKLCADPDLHVKNGTKLLDRLVKDVVAEIDHFDTEKFIPILQDRIKMTNPFVRQFLLGWISVLNSVPNILLVNYLPSFLDGILCMLSDIKNDLQKEAEIVLDEFLREIKAGKGDQVDYGAIVNILIPHCTSGDDLTRLICVTWLNELTVLGQEDMLPYVYKILGAILPGFSNDVLAVQEQTVKANLSLVNLITSTDQQVDIGAVLHVLVVNFRNQYVPTRIESLKWLLVLHEKSEKSGEWLDAFLQDLLPSLLRNLSDPSDEVVRLNLQVMALICQKGDRFQLLMNTLVNVFREDLELLEKRGSLIIRLLSIHLQAEKIFRALAPILEKEADVEYASLMVQALNFILLTSRELFEVRQNLKDLKKPENVELFIILYRSWCHNPSATLALCLLACMYEPGTLLINQFAELEITVAFLVEIDKLVQLLESPIFSSLRLQLLEPDKYPHLYKCLYGLLMLLPQSGAFETLRNRLSCAPNPSLLPPMTHGNNDDVVEIDFEPLLDHFVEVQDRHVLARQAARASSVFVRPPPEEKEKEKEKGNDKLKKKKKVEIRVGGGVVRGKT